MPSFYIRVALPHDAAALAELSNQLGYPSDAESIRQRLDTLLISVDHAVYLCESADAVVGWIHVMRTLHLESGFGAEIAGLIVSDTHRGKGIGTRLVRQALTWAHGQGFEKLRVRSRVEREGAHAFYRRLGFEQEKVQHVFACKVDGKLGDERGHERKLHEA